MSPYEISNLQTDLSVPGRTPRSRRGSGTGPELPGRRRAPPDRAVAQGPFEQAERLQVLGGAALSGGQRQRIALARAFFGDPVVVIRILAGRPDRKADEGLRLQWIGLSDQARVEVSNSATEALNSLGFPLNLEESVDKADRQA